MKFKEYLPHHEEIYPRPPKRSLALGWEFWVAVAVAIAAIVLASLRTAHSFYTAAVLSAQIYGLGNDLFTGALSLTEAAAAMLAIEGGIVYGAVKRAQHHGKVHPKLFVVYIGLLILISVIAGLGQSLGLILGLSGEVLAAFSWIMAIVLGVGASIVAWLSGEMLGVEMLKYGEANKAAEKSFTSASTRWLNDARKHWNQEGRGQPAPEVEAQTESKPMEPREQHKRAVKAFVSKFAMQERRFPSPGYIGSAVGLSGPYVVRLLDELKAESQADVVPPKISPTGDRS